APREAGILAAGPRPDETLSCSRSCCGNGAGLDLDTRTHGRGDRHALDVVALGAGRLRLDDGVGEGTDVFFQCLSVEGSLADTSMDNASLLDAELDCAAL